MPKIYPAAPSEQLNHLGVEVRTSTTVTQIEAGAVYVGNTRIPATVILWAAGVAASPLGKKLGVAVDRAGRVPVQPDLDIPGHPEIFVIGDLAAAKDEQGKLLPGVAPVAMQQGTYVAKLIRKETESGVSPKSTALGAPPFSRSLREGADLAVRPSSIIGIKAASPPSDEPQPSHNSERFTFPDSLPGFRGSSSIFFF